MDDTITEYMSHDHHRCDEIFAKAEESVADQDWEAAERDFAEFHAAMDRHFGQEEGVLFPAFENRAGPMGPTQVMRMEHQQMRNLFFEMQQAVAQKDDNQYLGLSETLLVLMQQHNMKEEQILYQMADRMLDGDQAEIIARMDGVRAAA